MLKTPRAKGCAGLVVPTWRSPKPKLELAAEGKHALDLLE